MSDSETSEANSGDSEEEIEDDVGEKEEEEEHIRQELLDIPLGQLQELREKVGMKKFDSALRESAGRKTQKQRTFKRDNKNKPREMPSHRPVSRFRHVVPVTKKAARDPRFGQRSGKFNETMFKKAYSFLDEVREKERKMAEKELRKTKDPERKSQLHRLIQKMDSQKLADKVKEEKKAVVREQRRAEKQLQNDGKKPFFLKKSVRRQLELAEKYKQLKESGRLERYLARRRKRNAQRDRRQLPFKRH